MVFCAQYLKCLAVLVSQDPKLERSRHRSSASGNACSWFLKWYLFPFQKRPRNRARQHSHCSAVITGRERRPSWLLCPGISLALETDTFKSWHALLGWGCLSFPMFPAVSGVSVGRDLVKRKLCQVGQQLDEQLGPSGVSGGSRYDQRGMSSAGYCRQLLPFLYSSNH